MKDPKTFEDALTELEKIVSDLEDGDNGPGASFEALRRRRRPPAALLRSTAQGRTAHFRGDRQDEAGNPVLKLFEHSSSVKPE